MVVSCGFMVLNRSKGVKFSLILNFMLWICSGSFTMVFKWFYDTMHA